MSTDELSPRDFEDVGLGVAAEDVILVELSRYESMSKDTWVGTKDSRGWRGGYGAI